MSTELGKLLGLCRELKGLSLRDVERETGISNATVCQIESGKHKPMFSNVVKLADLYGVSLDRLANTIREKGK